MLGKSWHVPKGSVAVLAALSASLPRLAVTHAEPRKEDPDLEHISVYWSVSHAGFSKVTGQFRQINKAELVFDPEDVAASVVVVEIEAASELVRRRAIW